MREHPLLALGARVVGDHDLDRHADDPADHGVRDAGVAGRAVQHGLARLEPPVVQGTQEHAQHGPVLERPPRIQRLHLREHFHVGQLAMEDLDRDQGSVPHGSQDGMALDERLDMGGPGHGGSLPHDQDRITERSYPHSHGLDW